MAQNMGQRVGGISYNTGVSAEEAWQMFDDLPEPLRRKLADMPARANVAKYFRLYHWYGLDAAMCEAEAARLRFLRAADAEKASGEYARPRRRA